MMYIGDLLQDIKSTKKLYIDHFINYNKFNHIISIYYSIFDHMSLGAFDRERYKNVSK